MLSALDAFSPRPSTFQKRCCPLQERTGTRWDTLDERQCPVLCRWSNQTVVTVSQHRDLWLQEAARRFPQSNHFIKSPASLPLLPPALGP